MRSSMGSPSGVEEMGMKERKIGSNLGFSESIGGIQWIFKVRMHSVKWPMMGIDSELSPML